ASDTELEDKLVHVQDDRIFYLAEALRRGYSLADLHELTKITVYFLDILKHIVELEDQIKTSPKDAAVLKLAKQYGFSDSTIADLWQTDVDSVRQLRLQNGIVPVYKMVDTCAAEFESQTP
ncbi:carbamoyl-phosphate synthase large subunit, partial [[Eubacterium] rectale]|nr:carbamoyl-phosphate synthase large subunit [Agathobacter rectalis]